MFTHLSKNILTLLALSIVMPSIADDTAILNKTTPTPPPKIMFLMDNSESMTEPVPGDSASRSRMQVLQDTFSSVIDSMDPSIEIGITTYGGDSWRERGISFPVSPLSDNATTLLTRNLLHNDSSISPPIPLNSPLFRGMYDLSTDNLPDPSSPSITVKDYLKEISANWVPNGKTPIPGAIYEVSRYFKGDYLWIGNSSPSNTSAAHPSTYTGSNYLVQRSQQYTDSCPTAALCSLKDTSDPLACELITSEYDFYTYEVDPCIADNTCSTSCTKQSYTDAPEPVECDSNTNTYCGINCGPNIGSPSEPLYQCMTEEETGFYYNCNQYYLCKRPLTDIWVTTTNARYISPITDECDSSFLVLLSDGQPFDDASYISDRQNSIKSFLSIADCAPIPGEDNTSNTLSRGRCAPELVHDLANTDLNTTLNGDQVVKTYTIGFGISDPSPAKDYLSLLATKGDGQYYSANDSANLTEVFQNLLADIAESSARSLAGSAVSVDASSQISHGNDVFIPVIKKIDNKPQWVGNLKKFSIVDGVIIDQNDNSAVKSNGTLKQSALDLWATQANTDPVLSGGAASLLSPVDRKLYTDIDGTATTTGHKGSRGTPLSELKTSNSSISLTMLNATDTGYRNELLDYARGYAIPVTGNKACTSPINANVTDTGNCTSRQHMGDILHSKPIVVSYDDSDTSKKLVFFGTNEGYLHAINADDGSEEFAFMPQSLLDNIEILYRNHSGDDHVYGVDGPITVWRHDDNKDGQIKVADNDHVYLYFGLRRGGEAYYALNVTDPSNPKLLWKIDNNSSGFSELGQTWSKPLLAKIKVSNTADEQLAMVVGAGYDDEIVDEEDRDKRNLPIGDLTEEHTKGRGIYIIDAENGTLIQSITDISGMDFSIPSDIRVLDMDKNGYMDRLYYSDTGGNIWRTDLFTHSSQPGLLSPTTRKFASLGEDRPKASIDTRKFFHEPEVSLFNDRSGSTLAITIGSGYHSQPLNDEITDRFYMLIDKNVFDTPTTAPTTITQNNLVDRSTLNTSITTNPNGKLGWYFTLPGNGEKALSSPFIFLNKVFFTTFKPGSGGISSSTCSTSNSHEAKLYAFSLLDGAAAIDFDKNGTKDISKDLPIDQILSTPKLFFRTPTCTSKDNCQQIVDLSPAAINNSTHPGKANGGSATESIDIGSFLPSVYWLNPHE